MRNGLLETESRDIFGMEVQGMTDQKGSPAWPCRFSLSDYLWGMLVQLHHTMKIYLGNLKATAFTKQNVAHRHSHIIKVNLICMI